MSTGNCLAVAASSLVSGILITGGNYLVPFLLTCAGYVATALLLYYYFRDTESRGSRSVVPVPVTSPVILLKNSVQNGPPALRPLARDSSDSTPRPADS
jgi:hypothetical protein